ncbi:hypothetical protein EB151_14085, partial [archaeon]|nr:hypothetical protein [archaeon]
PNNTIVYTTPILKTARAVPTVPTPAADPTTNVPSGATVTLTATPSGSGGYTYLWSNGATANPTTVTPTATTPYSVTVTDQYSCSATSTAVTVTVDPLVAGVIATSASSTVVCSGSTPAAISSSSAASGGTGSNYTYQWEKSTVSATAGFSPILSATSVDFTPSQAITVPTHFRRKVTNAGISTTSNVVSYTVASAPNVQASASPATVPSGGTTTLSATGATTYTWTETGTNTLGTPNTAGDEVEANPTVQTTYTVTGTDANGCIASDDVTVNVAALNAGTISGAQDVCVGATPTTITSTTAASGGSGISGNYVYNWQSSVDISFASPTAESGTGTTFSFSATIQAGGTRYYRRGVRDITDPNNTIV